MRVRRVNASSSRSAWTVLRCLEKKGKTITEMNDGTVRQKIKEKSKCKREKREDRGREREKKEKKKREKREKNWGERRQGEGRETETEMGRNR